MGQKRAASGSAAPQTAHTFIAPIVLQFWAGARRLRSRAGRSQRLRSRAVLWAFARGYITLTPLSPDLTDKSELDRLRTAIPLDEPQPEEATTEVVEEDE